MNSASESLKDRLQGYQGRLSKLDSRVVDVLLADPLAASYESARQVASRAGVHPSTVIRLARKLGYDGYQSMRASLRPAVEAGAAARIFNRLQRTGTRSIAESFVETEVDALRQLLLHIDQAAVHRAASLLAQAGRVFVYARGQASVLADLMAMRLERLGLDARSLHAVDIATPQSLARLQPGDVVVAFALRRIPQQLPMLLSYCAAAGGHSMVLADMIGPSIRPAPAVLLAAPRGSEAEWQTLSVPMAMANIVLLELSRLAAPRVAASLDQIEQTRVALESMHRSPMK